MSGKLRRFKGKTVLVTGAGSGIGRGIALRFAQEGANVVVLDVNAGSARTVTEEIRGLGVEGHSFVGDATEHQTVLRAVSKTRRLGGIDVLVNNVGLARVKPLLLTDEREWNASLDINLKAAFLWSKETAKQMLVGRRQGCIVNVASDCGKVGDPYSGAYVAAKHGVIGLTKNLAHELAPYGIRVNAVCPGWIDTPLLENYNRDIAALEGKPVEMVRKEILAKIPLRRIGTPDDVAGLVSFLASEDARYMTGQSINVTGGAVMF